MNWYLSTEKKLGPVRLLQAWCRSGTARTSSIAIRSITWVVILRWIDGGAIDGLLQMLLAVRTAKK